MEERKYPWIELRRVAGCNFLLDIRDKRHYSSPLVVNDMGAEVYRLLDSGLEYEDILERLSADYEVDRDTLRTDLKDYLLGLKKFGIDI